MHTISDHACHVDTEHMNTAEADWHAESDARFDGHVADNYLPYKRLWALLVSAILLAGT